MMLEGGGGRWRKVEDVGGGRWRMLVGGGG